jgi:hypothetical protein
MPSLADFTTTTPELKFSVHTGMAGGRFYGLASYRVRPQNGLQISSRKHAAGNKLPAISFVTGTGPMVRSLSVDFDRWAFATDQHRRAPRGKTHMLKD